MNKNISNFIASVFKESFSFVNPYLSNYSLFSAKLSKEVKTKKGGNIQYNFDIELDSLVKKTLKEFNITGSIFSEESGFFENGEKRYRVVFDPFCNSTLASKTFLEAAMGISIFSYDYEFITSAILDFQTGIYGVIEDGVTHFYQIQNEKELKFTSSDKKRLENSWIVLTLESAEGRKRVSEVKKIFENSKRILIGSGHIYWLRLAMGMIDGYMIPFRGEKLYEMFACMVAVCNGCVVTDIDGNIFDPVQILKTFEDNQDILYYPIAGGNLSIHEELCKKMYLKK